MQNYPILSSKALDPGRKTPAKLHGTALAMFLSQKPSAKEGLAYHVSYHACTGGMRQTSGNPVPAGLGFQFF